MPRCTSIIAGAASLPVELTCVVRSLTPRQVLVRSSDGSSGNVTIAGAGVNAPCALRFSLLPGWNTVRFETDGPAAPRRGRGTLAGSPSWWRSCSCATTVVARRRDSR